MSDRPPDPGASSGAYPGPHEYPFRFIDRIEPPAEVGGAGEPPQGGAPTAGFTVGAVLSSAGRAGRTGRTGSGGQSLALLVETMAQGALAALAGGGAAPDGASLRLAGVDDARLYAPVAPGDRLRVEAEVEGRFAALAKVACRLLRDDELVAEAKLLLAGDWAGA